MMMAEKRFNAVCSSFIPLCAGENGGGALLRGDAHSWTESVPAETQQKILRIRSQCSLALPGRRAVGTPACWRLSGSGTVNGSGAACLITLASLSGSAVCGPGYVELTSHHSWPGTSLFLCATLREQPSSSFYYYGM